MAVDIVHLPQLQPFTTFRGHKGVHTGGGSADVSTITYFALNVTSHSTACIDVVARLPGVLCLVMLSLTRSRVWH
jgi:hypothetical protein